MDGQRGAPLTLSLFLQLSARVPRCIIRLALLLQEHQSTPESSAAAAASLVLSPTQQLSHEGKGGGGVDWRACLPSGGGRRWRARRMAGLPAKDRYTPRRCSTTASTFSEVCCSINTAGSCSGKRVWGTTAWLHPLHEACMWCYCCTLFYYNRHVHDRWVV